jgi:hypothetical protein
VSIPSAKIGLIMNLPIAIERLRNVVRRQQKALSTEASYAYWLRHYVTALKAMPSSLSSEQKLENFLEQLGWQPGLGRVRIILGQPAHAEQAFEPLEGQFNLPPPPIQAQQPTRWRHLMGPN